MAKNTEKDTAADAAPAQAELDTSAPETTRETPEAAAPAKEPKVSADPVADSAPALVVGKKAKHSNGTLYTVLAIHKDGVKLEGVANLVEPSALVPA
jgi:sRNA-binding protein